MKSFKKGQIFKASSNSYLVKVGNDFINCNARGSLRLKAEGILVGDYVHISGSTIEQILPRKNRFIRPSVANVETVVIVVSPEPKPDLLLIDKLLVNAIKENANVIFAVNKNDLDNALFNILQKEYEYVNCEFISVSASSGDGILELKERLKHKLSVLAGQSAVGKTSIINALFGSDQKVGELSKKIARGRHTTTRSQIFEQDDIMIVDSPGFAVLDAQVELDELPDCYEEYSSVSHKCKFRGCSHVSEPDCAVKEKVKNGIFSENRYNRYVNIYNEISARRKSYE